MSDSMRRRNRTRSVGTVVLSAIMAVLVVGAAPVAAGGPFSPAKEPSADLAQAFGTDGTFRGAPGVAGTVDTSAWTLVSDLAAGEPPRFGPATGGLSRVPAGRWSALGSNGTGNGAIDCCINAIAVSGMDVYVGGTFSNAAGIPEADYVAKWNGSVWSALGSNGAGDGALSDHGFGNGVVTALALSGTNLYVGGSFFDAAGIPEADYVAKWNGSVWSALGSNGSGNGALSKAVDYPEVNALAVSGSDLYVGGNFIDAAGIATADHIAKWNGTAWSTLGSNGAGDGAIGYVDKIWALAVSGTDVYVGGPFTNAAGIPEADYVAKWNGSVWSALGSNGAGDGALNHLVLSVAVSGSDLFVGGWFTNAAGIARADTIAKWNGRAWSALGSNGSGNGPFGEDREVRALALSGTDLYVGGDFANAAGISTADNFAMWNGSVWSTPGSDGSSHGALNQSVQALAVFRGDLYVGGAFTDAAGIPTADAIARLALGSSVPPTVATYAPLVVFHPHEKLWPMSAEKFIRYSKLRFHHDHGCASTLVSTNGVIDPARLGAITPTRTYTTKEAANSGGCGTNGQATWRADQNTRPYGTTTYYEGGRTLAPGEGFYLHLADPAWMSGTHPQASSPTTYTATETWDGQSHGPVKVYYQYRRASYIRYWFFYGYSRGPLNYGVNDCCHEGDWEGIAIKLDSADRATRIHYFEHRTGQDFAWTSSSFTKVSGTHPKVYVGQGSHASYPRTDIAGDFLGEGRLWRTWSPGTLTTAETAWWGFGGAWGEVGRPLLTESDLTTGPYGPGTTDPLPTEWHIRP